jgi:mono/diheme cytochrome c family protein
VYDALFASSAAAGCGSCHGAAASPSLNGGLGGLSDKAAAHTALVGKSSSSAMCTGKAYVTAGDAAGSLLYQKIAAAPMCGMRMPPGGMVAAADVDKVKAWITAGAKND